MQIRSVLLAEIPSLDVRSGMPLPWDVHDAEGQLLLARGHLLANDSILENLIARGGCVHLRDASKPTGEVEVPPPLPVRYASLKLELAWLLSHPEEADFIARIRGIAEAVASLTERNVDQLIFLIIRHDYTRFAIYGSVHSLHVATVCSVLARRLGWSMTRHLRLVCAALTMNLSIIELQGTLAGRLDPLTDAHRALIHAHPLTSAAMLREVGLVDEEWLAKVEQHHEEMSGQGYPRGIETPTDGAQILRFADQFAAKHAWRADRGAIPAQQVARELYLQSQGHPLAALLIKEFGIFPPGCFVQLASGEAAIVVRRGSNANTPVVAAIISCHGDTIVEPVMRDTTSPEYAISTTLEERLVLARVSSETLYSLC
ncbi:hypothetical protein FXN63_19975 [Pigmentiphaga aceris]|uniref:Phosphohydrolase n=1 Tax=Pigmentiphaga aceris TaxID=1940612 RepID=A0A5C0AZH1_9BURK|nr:HD domain-containing phosphohydrolase [Pigmentiphaga aceris]QEI07862.1 hypothetical protein FXN63_19975 [Pigmentiphaga aceris]